MEFNSLNAIIAGAVLLVYMALLLFRHRWVGGTSFIRYSKIDDVLREGSSWRVQLHRLLPLIRVFVIVFLLLAIIRIRTGQDLQRYAESGVAMQMLVDRSSSMGRKMEFEGDEMSRLEVVKRVFSEFLLGDKEALLGRHGDMIALTSFAGFVEHNSPLTLDHENLIDFARGIKLASRIEDGTMIGDAIYSAALKMVAADEVLKEEERLRDGYKIESKVIILLTDGEQTRGGISPVDAAVFAKDNHIKIYTIAIVDESQFQKNDGIFGAFFSLGNRQVDTTLLEKVAEITGGKFAKASSGENLKEVYKSIDQLEKTEFSERFSRYKEMFPLFIKIALGLLILELIIRFLIAPKIP